MSVCVQLHLNGKHVLIVGGGKVAYRKAQQYVQEKAIVTIVSPQIEDAFNELPIQIISREYQREDIKGMFLVYAATNHKTLNQQVLQDAQKQNLMCGSAEKDEAASFSSMVCMDDSDILCAISTHGKYPSYHHDIKKAIKPYIQECSKKLPLLENLRNYICKHQLDKNVLSQLSHHTIEELTFLVTAIQKQKVTLLAFHGVANDKIIAQLYEDCKTYNHASEMAYGIAFMSEKVNRKLDGKVSGLQSMLSILHAFQVHQIRVISMLLTNGYYHQQVKQICESFQITIREALFQKQGFLDTMIDAYVQCYQKHNQLLFVLHEHESMEIKQHLHRSIQRYSDIHSCFFQEEISIDKHKPVLVIPFVMFMGHHATKDIVEGSHSIYAKLLHQHYDVTVLHAALYDQSFVRESIIQSIEKEGLL